MELPATAVPIKGAIDHWIDIDGSVYAIDHRAGRNKLIKKVLSTLWGYKYCGIRYEGTDRNIGKRVHRLVAEAFIPNPNNYPIVGHKNNIKSDNRVENLYWTTAQENVQKAVDDGLSVNYKGIDNYRSFPCEMFDSRTNESLGIFGSIKEAERETGIQAGTIARQCKYQRPTRKSYYFRYITREYYLSHKCESTIESEKSE